MERERSSQNDSTAHRRDDSAFREISFVRPPATPAWNSIDYRWLPC